MGHGWGGWNSDPALSLDGTRVSMLSLHVRHHMNVIILMMTYMSTSSSPVTCLSQALSTMCVTMNHTCHLPRTAFSRALGSGLPSSLAESPPPRGYHPREMTWQEGRMTSARGAGTPVAWPWLLLLLGLRHRSTWPTLLSPVTVRSHHSPRTANVLTGLVLPASAACADCSLERLYHTMRGALVAALEAAVWCPTTNSEKGVRELQMQGFERKRLGFNSCLCV